MPAKSLRQQAFAPRSGSFSARCAGRKARHCEGCRKSPSDFFDSLSPETVFRLRAFRHWKRERYRSGRNELDSKSSCRVTGTWVRIPASPLKNPCKSRVFGFLILRNNLDFAEHLRYLWCMICGTVLQTRRVSNEIH